MPIQIKEDSDHVIVIRALGKLVREDYPLFTAQFEQITRKNGKLRVLFDMTEFDGWDPAGIWEEMKFDIQHNSDIRRLAAVGEEKWHHALVMVFKPFAAAEVRYFLHGEADKAKHWLTVS